MPFAVELENISYRFGSFQALSKVSLAVQEGTIHALVGENGAGKTTLMKLLHGSLLLQEGKICVYGTEQHYRNAQDAIKLGIGMVSQHYGIIPGLTCLENLILGAEGREILQLKSAIIRATKLAEHMRFHFDWTADAETISPSSSQKLEILKLLWREAKILILDEPTAMLSPEDSEILFEKLKVLTSEGATAIVVTHRVSEVLRHCDEVTVLRSGKNVGGGATGAQTSGGLATMIMGRSVDHLAPSKDRTGPERTEYLQSIQVRGENITVLSERGHIALNDVSFSFNAGEMIGIAGVDGSGQRELVQLIAGIIKQSSGSLWLWGEEAEQLGTRERISKGLHLIAEDRQREAIIEHWPLEWNALLGYHRLDGFTRGFVIDRQKSKEFAHQVTTKFSTKYSNLNQETGSLSGGNQQRFVAARCLLLNPTIIVAFQPARGLDIGATSEVYQSIRDACLKGATAIVVSFDLDELLLFCDRIGVLYSGKLTFPPNSHQTDREFIGKLMTGVAG